MSSAIIMEEYWVPLVDNLYKNILSCKCFMNYSYIYCPANDDSVCQTTFCLWQYQSHDHFGVAINQLLTCKVTECQ